MSAQYPEDELKGLAAGFARYAFDYIEAARVIDDTIGAQAGHEIISPVPAYFLAMHGIELTLKAFLLWHGMTPRQFGHHVQATFETAKERGLFDIYTPREGDEKALALLSQLNAGQGLRYIREGWKEFPLWGIVEPLAVRLHQAVAPFVGYDKTFTVHYGDK